MHAVDMVHRYGIPFLSGRTDFSAQPQTNAEGRLGLIGYGDHLVNGTDRDHSTR